MVAQVRRRQNFWRFLDIGWGRGRGGGAGNERTDILGNLSNLGQDAGSINREKEEEVEEEDAPDQGSNESNALKHA